MLMTTRKRNSTSSPTRTAVSISSSEYGHPDSQSDVITLATDVSSSSDTSSASSPTMITSPSNTSNEPTTPAASSPPPQTGEKECSHCHTRETTLWRFDRDGNNTLCNPCGTYLRHHGHPRPAHLFSGKFRRRNRLKTVEKLSSSASSTASRHHRQQQQQKQQQLAEQQQQLQNHQEQQQQFYLLPLVTLLPPPPPRFITIDPEQAQLEDLAAQLVALSQSQHVY